MNLIKAELNHLDIAREIVRTSIEQAYPLCYPGEAVELFLHVIHTRENISRDIQAGTMWLMEENSIFFGTGCLRGDEIARVYLLPEYQGRGYGSAMMDALEAAAAREQDRVKLSPSLPAEAFYRRRGYRLISHQDCPLEHGAVLSRDVMEKVLR